jgi:uncharacterized membrane protein
MQTGLAFSGVIFAIIATYFLYSGFTLETAIDDTANLQLMHIQAMNLATGIGAAIISAVLTVGSAVVGTIKEASEPPA